MSKKPSSQRAKALEAARQRRRKRLERRSRVLTLVVGGFAYEEVAEDIGVSLATVRREVLRAVAARPPEPAETFVAVQRERLNKALQYNDAAMRVGEPRAVPELLALLPQVERYWGLQTALRAANGDAGGAHLLAPTPLKSLETKTEFPPLPTKPAVSQ